MSGNRPPNVPSTTGNGVEITHQKNMYIKQILIVAKVSPN